MRLKKLELFGFKSFADKTTIVFDQGVTCIVGPNGCGKSNISDSIRWVLGERSPKILRGSKMEDIIFNGTDFRKPIGFAEVSLTLDNSDKSLAIDYAEVTITRRLHRSGESEYLINKTTCRLKDIYDLILDTGLGSSSYSMIEQGKIDYILNADPDERRFLIEEAAGISKYEAKKDEAVRKLERTEENRTRLNDILHEVQKNIQYAERQAKRAQKYQEQFEKLKKLEIRKAFYDLTALQNQLDEISKTETSNQHEIQSLQKAQIDLRHEQEQINAALLTITANFTSEDSKRHQLQSRIDQNQQMLTFHQEKNVEMAARRGQLEQEQIQLRERLEKNNLEKQQKESEISALSQERAESEASVRELESSLHLKESEALETRKRIEQVKSEAFRIAMHLSQTRNEFHRIAAFLDTREEQNRKQVQSTSRIGHEITEWKSRETQLTNELEATALKLSDLSLQKFQTRSAMESLTGKIEENKKLLQQLEREIHESETELKILSEIEAQSEISDRSFLDGEESAGRLAYTLREICTVQPGYEWALESALESFSRSLVTEHFETGKKLLARFKDKKSANMGLFIRETFPQFSVSGASEAPVHPAIDQALINLVEVREDFRPLLDSFLRDVYVVREVSEDQTFKELIQLSSHSKFLLPDGTILGPQGRILFRSRDPLLESSLFQRASEIKRLEGLLAEKSSASNALSQQIQDALTAFEAHRSKLETLDSDLMDSAIQKESLESHRQGIQDRIGSLAKEHELLQVESDEWSREQQESLSQKEKLELQLKVAEEEEQNIRQTQEGILRVLEEVESAKTGLSNRLTESQVKLQHYDSRLKLIEESLAMLEENRLHDSKRIDSISRETEDLERKKLDLEKRDEEIKTEQVALDSERRHCEIALELIRREKEETEQKLATARQSFEDGQDKLHAIEQTQHQMAIKKMDVNYQEKNIHDRLFQVYKLQLADFQAADYPVEGEVSEMEATILQLREKLENIGTVNLLAIEEYDELKQRFDFLDKQMKDLEEAKSALLETIRQINRTTKSLFEQTFVEVQKNFQEYYQTLFRGGSAKLVLTDETNPLESGIDIMVRPPGKKLQHISLLSGGEKALTAIALLFALYKIKPSPFCVLDEVDAPLDEANIDRFLNVLETFLKLSQFIIVTHNRKTIAMGNSLYGVTMQEAGVSKIVSVKVSEDAAHQAPKSATAEDSPSIEEQLQR